MPIQTEVPSELSERLVGGVNLKPGTLGDQLDPDAVHLLVFLRHLGCIFCRETIADLRDCCADDPNFPLPLFFFQGSSTEGRALLRGLWPQARAVADASGEFYDAFGVGRAGLVAMFRPAVWSARSRAQGKGHEQGRRTGDIWRMPGMFLTHGREILWAHDYSHAADHPDYRTVREHAARRVV